MSRLLFLLAVVVVVYLLLRSFRKQAPKQDSPVAAEEMVRCAQCGVHLPKGESIKAGGNFYCSDAHRIEHTSK
ncbi:MAG: PP0621 family protein [Sideroxyarcus sp.]|nr:PP0621 family protein [Sideroxyarcus sp.]